MNARGTWLAIVGERATKDLLATKWRVLRVVPPPTPPVPGDRILVVAARRLRPAQTATIIGTADVHDTGDDGDLRIRHRIVAPEGHAPRLVELRGVLAVIGWTDDRLHARIGEIVPIAAREFDRVEAELHEAALTFGPPRKRDAHARPRTPGRRALTSARVTARARPR